MGPRYFPLTAIVLLVALLPLVRPDTQIQRRITAPASREVSVALIDASPTSLGTRTLAPLAFLVVRVVNGSMVVVGWYKLFRALHKLFGKILDNLLNKWAKSPPLNQVVIEAGRLRLEFGCAMSEPVPWEYLEDFARSKQDAVDRGFAEVRSQEWIWVNGDKSRRCYAGMRVAREGEDVIPPSQEQIAPGRKA
ncbi:hypothetical protein G7Y79_00052g087920 [Physcia stellaris]|nr:hypothetical protein G7Y79_00052g087920 [Physcia stellaris]